MFLKRGIMVKIVEFVVDEESGQGIVEYAFIMALIVMVVIGSVSLLGEKVLDLYSDVITP